MRASQRCWPQTIPVVTDADTKAESIARTHAAPRAKCGTRAGLPVPMTSLQDFKQFIGYPEIERLQAEFMADLVAE